VGNQKRGNGLRNLTSACYQRSDKIYAYTTIDSIFSMNKVGKELRRVEKILNLKNVVFWSYNPMFTEFLGKLNEKLFVFDTVDNWMEHPTYPKMMPPKRLKRNYFKIADKADLIFTVSQELKDFYAEMSRTKDVHWIPNGVDFEFFNRPSAIKQKTELDDFDKKIIGYFGTIESRLDLDLLAKVAEDHQDKEIAICGPIWPIVKPMFHKKMHKYKNVHTFGRIDYKVAPAYMNRFDVAIMPHKISEFTKSNNPMKLYEYLACGRPLVSTPSAGTEMFKDLIYLAEEPKAFSNLINKALTEDSPEKQFKRKNAIKAHSWKSRVDTMTDYLFKKLNL